jgi:hypothetical protein
MPSDHDVVSCDGCLERIRWAITVNGRRQAINADPDPKGNLAAHRDHTGTLKVRVLTATCRSPRPRPRASTRPGRRAAVRYGTWRWGR